jgi:outer membrane protein assembly factor BamB
MVICVDRNNGDIRWQHVAWSGQPEPSHEMNGWASATCATDGQRVYAFFGRGGGLHCYTVEGTHLWSRDLGQLTGPWGTAASPLLVGKLVIQNCDADENAYIVAFDKESGEEVWKVNRPNHRGWSSPILVNTGERDEVVVNGHTGVTAYAPDTGEQLWFCACERGRGSPTVTPAGGLLFLANGLSGGGAYCVRPGGSGDVTESRRLWFTRRGGRDLSSPIVIGDAMLIMGLRGAILTCYDTRNGDELWTKRIGGQVSASPISYDGLAFFMVESGDTVVIDPNSEMKIVATNSVEAAADEEFRASITPSDGQLFLRSNQHLYCVGVRKEKETS